jgi:transposase
MGQKSAEPQEQPNIWAIPDEVWPLSQTILDAHDPAKPKGPRRADLRRVLHGIIFRVRTGCQWHQLPQQFGDDRTVHRHCQPWCQRGLLVRLWAVLVQACAALGGVDGQWQAADAAMGKARMGGALAGRTPPIAGKRGETAPRGGGDGRASGRHQRGGQCPRHPAAGRHPGGQRGGAPPTDG